MASKKLSDRTLRDNATCLSVGSHLRGLLWRVQFLELLTKHVLLDLAHRVARKLVYEQHLLWQFELGQAIANGTKNGRFIDR
jgi:hypothetical protein